MFQPLISFLTDTKIGNGLSVISGVIAVFGLARAVIFWRPFGKHLKLETIYDLRSPDQGNTITVINNSAVPVLVSHWELVWRKGLLWREKRTLEEESDFDGGVLKIDAHDHMTLSFVDSHYFQWGQAQAVKGKLYLKLWIAGRRGFKWLMVYDPTH
jgi:hypothetical protein